jgi:hypothetical protein
MNRAELIDRLEKLTGAGTYRNDETGLVRKIIRTPRRGKWTLVMPRLSAGRQALEAREGRE